MLLFYCYLFSDHILVMTTSGHRLTVLSSKPGGGVARIVAPTINQINSARPIMRVPPLNVTTSGTSTQVSSILKNWDFFLEVQYIENTFY